MPFEEALPTVRTIVVFPSEVAFKVKRRMVHFSMRMPAGTKSVCIFPFTHNNWCKTNRGGCLNSEAIAL